MNHTFFNYLCSEDITPFLAHKTDYVQHTADCYCDGTNFYGMPNIDFGLYLDEYATRWEYRFKPSEFELFPEIGISSE